MAASRHNAITGHQRSFLSVFRLTRSSRRRLPPITAAAGIALLVIVVVAAVFAPLLTRVDPRDQDINKALLPPSWFSHSAGGILGTDELGRDMFSRVLYGGRASLLVGSAAVVLGGSLGVATGLTAGFRGGWLDAVLMRLVDIQLAFPTILLAIAVIAVLGSSLLNLILVLGVTGWVAYARIVRSEVLSTRERDYIQAARASGARDARIVIRHLLPNVAPSIIVIATLEVARMIIMEASLSFLGLGLRPPTPSWGSMVSASLQYMSQAWWPAVFPGLAITTTVLSINLVGDWMRSRLDPSLRR